MLSHPMIRQKFHTTTVNIFNKIRYFCHFLDGIIITGYHRNPNQNPISADIGKMLQILKNPYIGTPSPCDMQRSRHTFYVIQKQIRKRKNLLKR